jgi:hypothetical protein
MHGALCDGFEGVQTGGDIVLESLLSQTRELFDGSSSDPDLSISIEDLVSDEQISAPVSQTDAARQIVDSFLHFQEWCSQDVIWAIAKVPNYLRKRMCPESYALLIDPLAKGQNVLFCLSVLSAIAILLPDQMAQIASTLVPVLLPLIDHEDDEIRIAAKMLGGTVMCSLTHIDDEITQFLHQVVSSQLNDLSDGSYDDKVCSWRFFRSLMAMDRELFFRCVPSAWHFDLIEIFLELQEVDDVEELMRLKYGDSIKGMTE